MVPVRRKKTASRSPGRDAKPDTLSANGLDSSSDDLEAEASPLGERSSIVVCTLVGVGLEELVRD